MKKIDVGYIRKGDKIRYEYHEGISSTAFEYKATEDKHSWFGHGRYFLMERPYALPTEDGVYVRTDGLMPYYNRATFHLVEGFWEYPSLGLDHKATVAYLTSLKSGCACAFWHAHKLRQR